MNKFTVEPQSTGQRLDLYVTLSSGQFSRSGVRQLLDNAKITVNGEIEYRPNYKVKPGDVVEISTDIDTQVRRMPGYPLELKVIYKDADLLVVDKPAGLKVHPTATEDTHSLINAVYYMLEGELKDYGATLINRIDKDTSGLVAVALSPTGAWFYSRQFAEGHVRKEYLAVVAGKWLSHHGFKEIRVSGFLKYDSTAERQRIDLYSGEFAETRFKLVRVSEDGQLALLSAFPLTGRTHQIRVHLEDLGFPILGDVKYSGTEAPRLMLHSYKLTLPKSGGGELEVSSEIPAEFQV